MTDDLRIGGLLDGHEVVERDHLAGIRAQIILADIFWLRAEGSVRLHVHAIRAIVKVEVVHVHRTHVHLQRVSDLAEGHSQALCLFTVDAHKVLRVVGGEAGE